MAALEQAALSGSLFRPRSHSPTRSASTPSPSNTDDELGSDLGSPPSHHATLPPEELDDSSANLLNARKSAQTGPKGVIEDRRIQTAIATANREETLRKVRAEQSRQAIIALTVEEEVTAREKENEEQEWREREDDALARAKWRAKRRDELERQKMLRDDEEAEGGGRKRGGLKEVGQEGYLMAVERRGWVVVLIYEPDIPRCQTLLASLLHLSLNLPPATSLPCPISLFRARASSLAFSLLPPMSGGRAAKVEEDHGDEDYESPYEDEPAGRPDPDVLPSILAYKNGQLEKTWIRADWEVNEDGVEGLLRRWVPFAYLIFATMIVEQRIALMYREGILPPLNGLPGLTNGMKDLLGGSDVDE